MVSPIALGVVVSTGRKDCQRAVRHPLVALLIITPSASGACDVSRYVDSRSPWDNRGVPFTSVSFTSNTGRYCVCHGTCSVMGCGGVPADHPPGRYNVVHTPCQPPNNLPIYHNPIPHNTLRQHPTTRPHHTSPPLVCIIPPKRKRKIKHHHTTHLVPLGGIPINTRTITYLTPHIMDHENRMFTILIMYHVAHVKLGNLGTLGSVKIGNYHWVVRATNGWSHADTPFYILPRLPNVITYLAYLTQLCQDG